MTIRWEGVGAVFLALAVMLGAFGAHGLRESLSSTEMAVYEKAVFYHFIHGLGLLCIPQFVTNGLMSVRHSNQICLLHSIGITVFSGSLYLYSNTGEKIFAMVTPFGGTAFILGWGLLGWRVLRRSD